MMLHAGRAGDMAHCPNHAPQYGDGDSESVSSRGSRNVVINGRAALRVGDPGGGGGANAWRASRGSTGVFINSKAAFRNGDETLHAGGPGKLVEGSPDVFLGDMGKRAHKKRKRPHDKVVTVDITDALGRRIRDMIVKAFCPHKVYLEKKIDGSASIGGLCSDAVVIVHKALQVGAWDASASHKVGYHATEECARISASHRGGKP